MLPFSFSLAAFTVVATHVEAADGLAEKFAAEEHLARTFELEKRVRRKMEIRRNGRQRRRQNETNLLNCRVGAAQLEISPFYSEFRGLFYNVESTVIV